MRKKILIAEKSDAIRNIAESLLRQNGYDVISTPTADKAKELIITSEPNMIIIDAGLKDQNGAYLHDLLEESEQTASIPFVIIADADGRELSFPPEVILPRPFENDDFLEKVKLFVGTGEEKKEKIVEADPFSADSVNDEFLDAALGLDNIDVESSEVMDKTTITDKSHKRKKSDSDTDSDFGIAQKNGTNGENGENGEDSGRVESLMIREDEGKKGPVGGKMPLEPSASGKIEIASNQFDMDNLQAPSENKPKEAPPVQDKSHDYDWFINEMQKDTKGIKFPEPDSKTGDSGSIETTATSEGMEPIKVSNKKESKPPKPEIKSGGVDKFISDFKQEMEQLNPQSEFTPPPKAETPKPETIREAAPSVDIGIDINHLADVIAEKIVKQLTAKIDKQEIARMILEYLPQSLVTKDK